MPAEKVSAAGRTNRAKRICGAKGESEEGPVDRRVLTPMAITRDESQIQGSERKTCWSSGQNKEYYSTN